MDDVAIATAASPPPLIDTAALFGLDERCLIPYGRDKAKVSLTVLQRPRVSSTRPRLVLVSAVTPTPAGEGKTTTSIGLGQGLAALGESVCIALREPSLGPCMGMKGGATGGGYAQITPAEEINLHFTGDMHAVTSAHNLLAAVLDNHLHHGNPLDIEPNRVLWRRVIDMNDRSLRNVIVGLGGVNQGIPRESGFDITAASEIMAMLCLAEDIDDLRSRIDRTLVAYTRSGAPVTAGQLGVTGAMLALLRDALLPNLVQTLDGVPTLVHGGPFANIAHGCSSVVATRVALHLADWCVTEAGFGFDLGAEKFFDIKCRSAELDVDAVVLVATVRALKMHGGAQHDDLETPDPDAVRRGLPNLDKHIENIRWFERPLVVALNRFSTDSAEELATVLDYCRTAGIPCEIAEHYAQGATGATALAQRVIEVSAGARHPFPTLYTDETPVVEKIEAIAHKMYGAIGVRLTGTAEHDLADVQRLGYTHLPVCVAKTHSSLADDPKLHGRPQGFSVTISRILVNAGAGFLVVITGGILRMPGLPSSPQAERVDVVDGEIVGLP